MPIDSRDKRASILMHSLPMGRMLPLAQGTVANDDLEQLGFVYRLEAAAPTGVDFAALVAALTIQVLSLEAMVTQLTERSGRPPRHPDRQDADEPTRTTVQTLQGRPVRPPRMR